MFRYYDMAIRNWIDCSKEMSSYLKEGGTITRYFSPDANTRVTERWGLVEGTSVLKVLDSSRDVHTIPFEGENTVKLPEDFKHMSNESTHDVINGVDLEDLDNPEFNWGFGIIQ